MTNSKTSAFSKIAAILLTVVIASVLIVGASYAYKVFIQPASVQNDQIIGGDQDEHGCYLMAGYSWCEAKQKCLRPWEEGCEDEVLKTFQNLENQTNIDFSKTENVEFSWQEESENNVDLLTIQGLKVTADRVSDEKYQEIVSALKNDGFEDDKYNGAGSFVGSQAGFRKDNFSLVCLVNNIWSDFDEDDQMQIPETSAFDKDVTIRCGLLDKSQIPVISTEFRLRQALAAKHNKKVAEVTVKIDQEAENHAKGGVEFQPGGSENSGMFLAIKAGSDQWQIVFDGNGSIACSELEPYSFPADMITNVCY